MFGCKGEFLLKDADPNVIFYGRYIDDCFGMLYAQSAQEALDYIQSRVVFTGCEIKWAVSEFNCQFLDIFLYKELGKLEWKPFVKAGNNRERIPWVSHHPLDVKRGVYVGECSRLAVLCSNKRNYLGAIKDLNLLYVMRGYPEKLVMAWCKRNIQERWEKRFVSRTNEREESVLVLKSRYDDVWNFFSAAELGKTVTDYWTEWVDRAREGRYSADPVRPFPPPDSQGHDLVDVHPKYWETVLGADGDEESTPSLGKIGLLGSRWIVSRKRTKNLFDLATKWKNTVFDKLDEVIVDDIVTNVPNRLNTMDNWLGLRPKERIVDLTADSEISLHRRDSDDEMEHPEFGRLSKYMNT